jgi:anti-sigma-K factor RskA
LASGIEPPAPGRTYQLWFITASQQKISAGTFVVDENGDASYEVQVPSDIGEIAMAAITDEPAGGSNQPTGQIRVMGSVRETT